MKNQTLYNAALSALTERGCPKELAESAAAVVSNDDPTKENLGRTESDQQAIQKVVPYLQGNP